MYTYSHRKSFIIASRFINTAIIIVLSIILTSACCRTVWPENGVVDYRVPGKILRIKQPKSMDCWATVATMLLSWKIDTTLTVQIAMESLGNPWLNYYQTNLGLPSNEEKAFLKAMGLSGESPANYTLLAYQEMLKEYGPLWITIGGAKAAHARLLIAIRGDGTYEKTYLEFIDPRDGSSSIESMIEFATHFEEEARYIISQEHQDSRWREVDFRIQIIHW